MIFQLQKPTLLRGGLWLLLLLPLAFSIPVFHEVNKYQLNGEQCPLNTFRDAQCPRICVARLDDCPKDLIPTCPKNQVPCFDGTCAKKCPQQPNPCLCNQKSYPYIGENGERETPIPCLPSPLVDISHYNYRNRSAQFQSACADEIGVDATSISEWGSSLTESPVWLECPVVDDNAEFTFLEPLWLVLWSIIGGESFLIAIWCLYKRWRERNTSGAVRLSNSAHQGWNSIEKKKLVPIQINVEKNPPSPNPEDSSNGLYQLTGYKNCPLGTTILYSLVVVSLGWLALLTTITLDYYGVIDPNNPYSLSHGSYTLSAKCFVVMWYAMALWFLGLNIKRARLRSFFRLRTAVENAHVIQAEMEEMPTVLLEGQGATLKALKVWEARFKQWVGWHVQVNTVPLHQSAQQRFYINLQCTRYVYNHERNLFAPFQFNIGSTSQEILASASGLTQLETDDRYELVGPNFISVPVPTIFEALAREFTGFFYLYQLSILWLYFYYSYYLIGVVDSVVIIVSALVKVYARLQSERRLKRMAEHEAHCQVLRDGDWEKKLTSCLVPGDIFRLEAHQVIPCDAVLVEGHIVVDESSLTGEALPVRKFPVREDGGPFDPAGGTRNSMLFAGTTVSQADSEAGRSMAMAYRTGTATGKGQLVRKILYPSPVTFIFNEQLKVVMLVLATQGVLMLLLGVWFQKKSFIASWFNGMTCLAQLISPLLPAALVAGQSAASTRLRKKNIFCVDLPRINIAGKVQIFAFDKTGTLTHEGLTFHGVQPTTMAVASEKRRMSQLSTLEGQSSGGTPADGLPSESTHLDAPVEFSTVQSQFSKLPRLLRKGLASAHTVTSVDGKLIGNPVDIEMFRATEWIIASPVSSDYLDTLCTSDERSSDRPLHVLRRFEFIHAKASMAVVVKDSDSGHSHIFVKGSFEKIKDMVDPASIPPNYDQVTAKLAGEGCYVLAMAHRDLGMIDGDVVMKQSREELEHGCDFIGLVLFKNHLKEDTADAIAELKHGSTRTVMITGDTALTGVYISRACGMSPPDNRILLGDVTKENALVWTDVDTDEVVDLNNAMLSSKNGEKMGMELAVTGKAFRTLISNDIIRQYLLDIRIFARMTPQDKVDCVKLHMERGITAMCGDGGNDCGALRAAHVGIALSEAEASIVSPFSTNVRSIFSCVELLRQGRAALATSFAEYKYLIMYGQTMAMLKCVMFYFSTSISQPMWIVVDAFITVGMSAAISLSRTASKLAAKRPTARLLGPQTLASVCGLVAINWFFMVLVHVWLFQQPWFRCHEFNSEASDISKWWLLGDNYESVVVTLLVMYQFINSGVVFNLGYLFRRSWWRNYVLISLWVVVVALMSYIQLADPNWLGCIFRINCGNPDILVELGYPRPTFAIEPYNIESGHTVLPRQARWQLWAFIWANMIAGIAWEQLVVLGPVRRYFMKKSEKHGLRYEL